MKRRAWRQARRAIVCARPDAPVQAPPSTLYEELAIGYHIRQLAKLEQWFIAQGLPVPE
jgi:hypothetical protein